MRKFLVVLKKEIRELLTVQMILPLLISILLFAVVGKLVGTEAQKAEAERGVLVIDHDKTVASKSLVNTLEKSGFKVFEIKDRNLDSAIGIARDKGLTILINIPDGFELDIKSAKTPEIETYTILRSFSYGGTRGAGELRAVLAALNDLMSSQKLRVLAPGVEPEKIKNPLKIKENVIVGDKIATASVEQIVGFITSQTTFIPIILTIVIILSSQMIATAIASEKENKTLETLLSLPIGRKSLVTAKMVAAGLIALLAAGVYIFGFRYYMEGITGHEFGKMASGSIAVAAQKLGLVLTPLEYVTLGISLFFGILCALSLSIILGAFSEDVKSIQTALTPLMVVILIPYFLVLFLDINTISPVIRYLVLANPFSHPFLAGPNLFLKNYISVFFGILYEIAFFVVFVYIAGRIFSSDKILTMKLKVKRKETPMQNYSNV